jgi:hypothetical protein
MQTFSTPLPSCDTLLPPGRPAGCWLAGWLAELKVVKSVEKLVASSAVEKAETMVEL